MKLRAIILVGLLALGRLLGADAATSADTSKPSEVVPKTTTEIKTQPKQDQAPIVNSPPPAVSAPAVQQLAPTYYTTIKSGEDKGERDEKTTDYAMDFFTFLLVIVGGLQVTWIILTLNSSKDSAQRQLRAYIGMAFPEGVTPTAVIGENGNNYFILKIKNTGQTPAYNVVAQGKIYSNEYPQVDYVDPIIDPQKPIGKIVLSPQQEFDLRCYGAGRAPDKPGTTFASYIIARVEYVDAFKNKHWTNFCFVWRYIDGVNRLVPAEKGNTTDDYPDE
jgi:hypothetical protein